ncbi:MAG: CHAT domain-containing protein [Pseudomonadota bacterium]
MGEWQDLITRAKEKQSHGCCQDALHDLNEALERARSEADPVKHVETLRLIGKVYAEVCDFARAEQAYNQALRIQGKGVKRCFTANDLVALARAYKERESFPEEAGCLRKALEVYRKEEENNFNLGWMPGRLGTLAVYCKNHGHYQRALNCYETLLAYYGETGQHADLAKALSNQGIVHKNLGQYGKAMDCYRRSLGILIRIAEDPSAESSVRRNARFGESLVRINAGIVYSQLNRFDEAEEQFARAVRLQEGSGGVNAVTHHVLGMFYLKQHKLDEAGRHIGLARNPASEARLHLARGNYEEARKVYESILEDKERRTAYELFAAYAGLGRIHEDRGSLEEAEKMYGEAARYTEKMRSDLGEDNRDEFFDIQFEGFPRTAPYEGLARILFKSHRWEDALWVSEQTKARVFAESLSRANSYGEPQASPNGVVDLGDVRESFRRRGLREGEHLLVYDVSSTGILIYLIVGTCITRCLFKEIVREDLQRMVGSLRKSLDLSQAVDHQKALESFDLRTAKALFDLLVGDLVKDGALPEGRPLFIVPDEFLGVLPFETLVWEMEADAEIRVERSRSDGGLKRVSVSGVRFLGDRNPICYHQSVTSLQLARSRPTENSERKRFLVLGDPVCPLGDTRYADNDPGRETAGEQASFIMDEGLHCFPKPMPRIDDHTVSGLLWKRLPRTEDLARSLGTMYGADAVVLLGKNADKKRFKQEIVPQMELFHTVLFATHGYFGPELEEPILLLSAGEGSVSDCCLTMKEVRELDMQADLAALVACHTGTGEVLPGEGVLAMGRAFQEAGARSVLMSLWSVHVDSSVELMKSFFEYRNTGRSKLESLQRARAGLRGECGCDHPFFWAAFVLVGEPD